MNKWFRLLSIRLRRFLFNVRVNLLNHNPLIETICFIIIAIIIFLLLVIFRKAEFSELVHFSLVIIIQGLLLYFFRRNQHNQAILVEITTAYLIDGEKPYIDALLGKLISGNWKREEIIPGDALFKILKRYCSDSDYLIKRRIAEALPALCEINKEKGFDLLLLLRQDWDEDKWKGDNRRRAIESLITTISITRLPIIFKYKKEKIFEILTLAEDDQIFTAFAISDVLFEWRRNANKKTIKLIDEKLIELNEDAKNLFDAAAIEALQKNSEFNYAILNSTKESVFDNLKALLKHNNYLVRTVAARNILVDCKSKKEATLELIHKILEEEEHRYVRRPMAKESTVFFIEECMEKEKLMEISKKIFIKLVTDVDSIIRITTFDLIEPIIKRKEAKEFSRKICELVLANEHDSDLVLKARKWKEMVEKL